MSQHVKQSALGVPFTFTLMGCGSSAGVPFGPGWWGACDPDQPRNRRTRSAALVQSATTTVLIDAGPDIRQQLLDTPHERIDHVFITHEHSDHIAGLDDLRFYVYRQKKQIEVSMLARTAENLRRRMGYLFQAESTLYPALYNVTEREISDSAFTTVTIGDLRFDLFEQPHGDITSIGMVINGAMAYSTDCVDLAQTTLDLLAGQELDLWIVDAAVPKQHYSHANTEMTLAWTKQVKAKHNVFTHLGHNQDYQTLADRLNGEEPYAEPAYDGMVFGFDASGTMIQPAGTAAT